MQASYERETQLIVEKSLFALVDLLRSNTTCDKGAANVAVPSVVTPEQATRWRSFIQRVDMATRLLEQTLDSYQNHATDQSQVPVESMRKRLKPQTNLTYLVPAGTTAPRSSTQAVNSISPASLPTSSCNTTSAILSCTDADDRKRDEVAAALLASQVLCDMGCASSVSGHRDAIIVEETKVSKYDKKKRSKLPKAATTLLKTWLYAHAFHPYPTEEEKAELAKTSGLTMGQLNNWFTNARRRLLPKQQQQQQQQSQQSPSSSSPLSSPSSSPSSPTSSPSSSPLSPSRSPQQPARTPPVLSIGIGASASQHAVAQCLQQQQPQQLAQQPQQQRVRRSPLSPLLEVNAGTHTSGCAAV